MFDNDKKASNKKSLLDEALPNADKEFKNQLRNWLPDNFFDRELSSSFRFGILEGVVDHEKFRALSSKHPEDTKEFLLKSIEDEDKDLQKKLFLKLLHLDHAKKSVFSDRPGKVYIVFTNMAEEVKARTQIKLIMGPDSYRTARRTNTIEIYTSLQSIIDAAGDELFEKHKIKSTFLADENNKSEEKPVKHLHRISFKQ